MTRANRAAHKPAQRPRGRGVGRAPAPTLAARLDALYAAQLARKAQARTLEAQRIIELEEAQAIIAAAQLAGVTVVQGKLAVAELKPGIAAKVTDWTKLYAFIKAKGAWDLIQKRLAEAAFTTRTEKGQRIPGIETSPKVGLSIRARRASDVR